MTGLGTLLGAGSENGCRRCQAEIPKDLVARYCDACLAEVGTRLAGALAMDVDEGGHGVGQARHELADVLARLGRVEEARAVQAGGSGVAPEPEIEPGATYEEDLRGRIFPVLYAAEEPVPAEALARILDVGVRRVRDGLAHLDKDIASLGMQLSTKRVDLEEASGEGYYLETTPESLAVVRRYQKERPRRRLSAHAKKTLLILMRSRTPVTRREIEEVRGPSAGRARELVDVGPVLQTLMKEGLVAQAGRLEDKTGRPILYRATQRARERFPGVDQLAEEIMERRRGGDVPKRGNRDSVAPAHRTEEPDSRSEDDHHCRPPQDNGTANPPSSNSPLGPYDSGYATCSCFWGRTPGSLVQHLLRTATVDGSLALDAGCGEAKNAYHLAEHGARVIAIDSSALALANARLHWPAHPKVLLLRADVRHCVFPDATFDIVIAYGLLHCLPSHPQLHLTLTNLQSWTRPGGYLVLCSFNDRYQDLSAHPGFSPTLWRHSDYVGAFPASDWTLEVAYDDDLTETHPDTGRLHTHSLTRVLARKHFL